MKNIKDLIRRTFVTPVRDSAQILSAKISGDAGGASTFVVTSGTDSMQEPSRSRILCWIRGCFDQGAKAVHLGQPAGFPFEDARVLVYCGVTHEPPPGWFLKGLRKWLISASDRRLVWIGYNAPLFDFSRWGFRVTPDMVESPDANPVMFYLGRHGEPLRLDLTSSVHFPAEITDPSRARCEAYADCGAAGRIVTMVTGNGGLSTGSVMYADFHPADHIGPWSKSGSHLALMDMLHDVYGSTDHGEKQMFIRFEDVNASTVFESPGDTPCLTGAAAFLSSRKIPFTLAVIPKYLKPGVEPGKIIELHLSPKVQPHYPEFLERLNKTMELSPCSTVVAHGYSHSHDNSIRHEGRLAGEDSSGWGFEFGMPGSNREVIPLIDIEEARERTESALRELADAGIREHEKLVGWETPHYCATPRIMAEVIEPRFGLIFENGWWESQVPALCSHHGTLSLLPYFLRHNSTRYLQTFHEFVGRNGSDCLVDAKRVIDEAALLSKLRNGVQSSFFFHADIVPLKHLETIINSLMAQGWKFPPLG
ncbi:MAG: DUF2334 domain-containing protein [Myxococcota bacterium]|jgi:hypothetical protein